MKSTEAKALVVAQNPFVLGRYPGKPAPAHVFNGLVVTAFGASPVGAAVRRLLASDDPPIADFPALKEASWVKDPARLRAFQTDLSVILNPDRRSWEAVGSLVPVHGKLATSDPSDEGIGRELWRLVVEVGTGTYKDELRELLEPVDLTDPVSALADILVAGDDKRDETKVSRLPDAWFAKGISPAGSLLASNLFNFIESLTVVDEPSRPFKLQNLGRGLYFSAVLALLLGPATRELTSKPKGLDEIAPLVVWGDVPPGSQGDPMIDASARSFRNAVERGRASIALTLAEALAAIPIASRLPKAQRGRQRLRGQMLNGGADPDRIDKMIDNLLKQLGGQPLADGGEREWSEQLVESLYPFEHVATGIRSMGRKVGLIGPDRGYGVPRFLVETPLLGTIVSGLFRKGERNIPFADFVDRARIDLGLVFGPGSDETLVDRLGLWEGSGMGRKLMLQNENALRLRMIRAGLATEYSDGNTEVLNDVR